jgi:hypothetical protein
MLIFKAAPFDFPSKGARCKPRLESSAQNRNRRRRHEKPTPGVALEAISPVGLNSINRDTRFTRTSA